MPDQPGAGLLGFGLMGKSITGRDLKVKPRTLILFSRKERDINCFEDTAEECVKRCLSALHCPQSDSSHRSQHTWCFKAWGHFQSQPERLTVIPSKDLLCPPSNQIIEVRWLFSSFFKKNFFFYKNHYKGVKY